MKQWIALHAHFRHSSRTDEKRESQNLHPCPRSNFLIKELACFPYFRFNVQSSAHITQLSTDRFLDGVSGPAGFQF